MSNSSAAALSLVYDGDCPFCSATARMYRLKQAVGELRVVNAREAGDTPLMREIIVQGLDLNQGIVAQFNGKLYCGVDALHLLALLGSEKGWLNRLNVALFRNRATVAFAYPFLKFVRNSALTLLGRKPI